MVLAIASIVMGGAVGMMIYSSDERALSRASGDIELLAKRARTREAQWLPDGAGFSSFTVIDANGQSDTVTAFVE